MKSFFNLKFGDKFSVDGVVYQKENFFSAVRSLGTRDDWAGDAPLYRHYYPWEKVETVEFPENPYMALLRTEVRQLEKVVMKRISRSSPFLDCLEARKFPGGISSPPPLGERMHTHYVGDGCNQVHNDDERTGPSC